MLAKSRLSGKQIADLSHHNRLFGGHIQNPVIVFHPRTALGLDHAHHAEGFCNSAVVRRREGAIKACLLRARPWHALRARGVIQMYVRVDNGDGIFLGIGTCYGGGDRNRPSGSCLYEFASIHFGFLLCAILNASGLESRLRPYYLVPSRGDVANRTKCPIMVGPPGRPAISMVFRISIYPSVPRMKLRSSPNAPRPSGVNQSTRKYPRPELPWTIMSPKSWNFGRWRKFTFATCDTVTSTAVDPVK